MNMDITQKVRRNRVKKQIFSLFVIFSGLWLLGSNPAYAREVIQNFESDIWVHSDSTLTVREAITVYAEGRQIKRGIYRDFPTNYKDRYGNSVRVGFTVEKVMRDGTEEPFHTVQQGNGIRVYIGDKNVQIPKGKHKYVLKYKTSRQIGFFENFDELYYNITGNGWAFEIERASGRIHLPSGAEVLKASAYTGYQGEAGSNYSRRNYTDGVAFHTTQPLAPQQGLTIAVSWPVGFVEKPTEVEQATFFLKDNAVLFTGIVGVLVLFLYYIFVWFRVGKDPAPGTIIPLFEPPSGYSPAATRYIMRSGFDNKVFAAAIVSMAVKGYLEIEEDDKGVYTLIKADYRQKLSPGEKSVARSLFPNRRLSIKLKQGNHRTLQSAKSGLKSWLRTEFETIYFKNNTAYFVPGVAISAVVFGAMIATSRDPAPMAFIALWLSIWTIAIYFLLRRSWRAWQAVLAGGGTKTLIAAIVSSVFAIPFVVGEFVGLSIFVGISSPFAAALFAVLQLINISFYHLLKAPTQLGRKMMDKFAGFSEFLSVAEKDRMNFANPPERTPELFEKFLPYALALGVEQAWSEQFSDKLQISAEGPWSREYKPNWYRGRHFNTGNLTGFSSSLSNGFTSAISSASTSPGSSSGSSGGGSSGGGGGGGGGGGW
ncbi:DUF2207 domain-containing protein [Sneathiella marina]|uniref:DUF2207 domain-containing protein n=1 Tax=Sneathiella marina TaxID=2950108 RepID=A0ABY4W1H9_9PROT|nr:DUF2207 domain-containing protein [Sneathiella marina]USG60706.1 DUF2207 domain-containing protein [Sneathiella marina]